MSIIAETSAALIAKINALCGDYLQEVAEHPGNWDDNSVRRLMRNPPAVYVAWLGQIPNSSNRNTAIGKWGVFVVADVLNGQRRDNIGIYQVVERLTAGINGVQIAPSNQFTLTAVQNLWSDTQSEMGVAVYGMYFDAVQPLMEAVDDDNITDFRVYAHTFDQSADSTDDKTKLWVDLPTGDDNGDI